MFKLLTDAAREEAEREYKLRRAVVSTLALSALLFIGLVAILPSYIISTSRVNEEVTRTEVLKHSPAAEDSQTLTKWLEATNATLAALSPSADTDKPYEFFVQVLGSKPAGVSVGGLEWKKEGSKAVISLSGVARDRKALLAFQDALNASGRFSKVVLPVSNFAKDHDLEFEFSVSPLP